MTPDLASPAVAGLAAYFMSLDQYRTRLQVPGSVARNVRDLIKELAYARRALQPAVVWNGIDSRQIQCPVRRDASSGCPALNTTLPIGRPPPQTRPPTKGTATSSSSAPSSLPKGGLTITQASSILSIVGPVTDLSAMTTSSSTFNPPLSITVSELDPPSVTEGGSSSTLVISVGSSVVVASTGAR